MIIPNIWKNSPNVPNHQPACIDMCLVGELWGTSSSSVVSYSSSIPFWLSLEGFLWGVWTAHRRSSRCSEPMPIDFQRSLDNTSGPGPWNCPSRILGDANSICQPWWCDKNTTIQIVTVTIHLAKNNNVSDSFTIQKPSRFNFLRLCLKIFGTLNSNGLSSRFSIAILVVETLWWFNQQQWKESQHQWVNHRTGTVSFIPW